MSQDTIGSIRVQRNSPKRGFEPISPSCGPSLEADLCQERVHAGCHSRRVKHARGLRGVQAPEVAQNVKTPASVTNDSTQRARERAAWGLPGDRPPGPESRERAA